jgi:hypothetical protein
VGHAFPPLFREPDQSFLGLAQERIRGGLGDAETLHPLQIATGRNAKTTTKPGAKRVVCGLQGGEITPRTLPFDVGRSGRTNIVRLAEFEHGGHFKKPG